MPNGYFEVYKDIYYLYLNKDYEKIIAKPENQFIRLCKTLVYLVSFSALCLLNEIKKTFRAKKVSKLNNSALARLKLPYWFYIDSRNNFKTVDFIYDALAENSAYVTYKSAKFTDNKITLKSFNNYISGVKCIKFLFHIALERNFIFNYKVISLIYRTFNFYPFYKEILRNFRPSAIFFSNDHTPSSRSLLLAANELDIKTIFLQHASMSSVFPPLKYSLSLLDGQHSLDLYKQIGNISGENITVGISRMFMQPEFLNTSSTIESIGFAYNLQDDLAKTVKSLQLLIQNFPEKTIIVRKHPRDERTLGYNKNIGKVIESDSKVESSLDYLRKTDVLIANNSSILLEAAILNVLPVQFNLSDHNDQIDYYGFIKNGLAIEAKNESELIRIIKDGREATLTYRMKARYYDASIGEDYEFNTRGKVLEIVKNYLDNNSLSK